jgi:BirA family biotin operon repressor/biotin-[acetyl-CoA-carboxylase] ligase
METDLYDPEELSRMLAPLLETGEMLFSEIDMDQATLQRLGFQVEGGLVSIPDEVERLHRAAIRDCMSDRAHDWILDLSTHQIVGSTSTMLDEMAGHRSIHGLVKMAELQIHGRGRRGRDWFSPYANNLALSVGAHLPQTPAELGGFSLCVGLAIADVLQGLGIEGVELKWPNDVLILGKKVAGILIELHTRDSGSEVVIGIGLNFHLPPEARASIRQPVTDLREVGAHLSRNRVAGALISSLVDFIEGFAGQGFRPMIDSFNRLHRFQDRPCYLIIGEERISGLVRGVAEGGALLLEIDGRVRAFHSGEVSLRAVDSG